jgi:hypothetical protein
MTNSSTSVAFRERCCFSPEHRYERGFRLAEAYRQKVVCIRVGIVLNLSGMTLAGLAILLSPA